MAHADKESRDQEPEEALDVSVVAPAHNEQENMVELVTQVGNAMTPTGLSFELIVVDDGSTDSTRARLKELMKTHLWLRCIAMTNTPPGKGHGQSAAFHAGFRECRGWVVASLDADLQNDPADIPKLLRKMRETSADMVQGDRSLARKDNAIRKFTSWIGRVFRGMILADTIRDTGCSLRVMRREVALKLPLELKGMHRFIPVTARHLGYQVVEMPVNHRARVAGETKYGFGIIQRGIPGLIDCFAVRYMRNQRRPVDHAEVRSSKGEPEIDDAVARVSRAVKEAARGGRV